MSVHSGGKPPDQEPRGSKTPKHNQQYDDDDNMSLDTPIGNVHSQNIIHFNEQVSTSNSFITALENQTLNFGSTINKPDNLDNYPKKQIANETVKTVDKNNHINKTHQTYKYDNFDTGPYYVYVENINTTSRINSFKIGDIILTNWIELDNKIKSIDVVGRHRVRIHFKDAKSANYFIDCNNSTILKKNDLEIYLPKFLLHRQGVIRGISAEFTEEYIKNKIKPLDHHCKFDVVNVKRVNRKVTTEDKIEYVPTQTIIVTFKAQTLPKYVLINKVIAHIETYVQKVLLCYNCFRYGHMGKQCKSKPRCFKCGENHISSACQNQEAQICLQCGGNHFTTQLNECVEFKRQKQIKNAMSELNISYNDACKQIPRKSYADVVHQSINQQSNSAPPSTNNNTVLQLNTRPQSQPRTQTNVYTNTLHNRNDTKTDIHKKRPRPASPDPISIIRSQILTPVHIPNQNGGILNNENYQSNVLSCHNNMNSKDFTSIILEMVMYIINTLKEKNSFDAQQSEIINLIQNRLQNSNQLNSQT